MDFRGKRVYIAPHTPKTTAYKEELAAHNTIRFKGFLDKVKEGADIYRPNEIQNGFDYILILSQNHFDAIYQEYKKLFPEDKLIKVDMVAGEYVYLTKQQIKKQQRKNIALNVKRGFLQYFRKLLDAVGYQREGVLFISKSFIGTNNKALFLYCIREGKQACIATDNTWQYRQLQKYGLPVVWLGSWQSYLYMALAKTIVQDQGNFTRELNLLSPRQTTVQLWHGIPLKRMNKLVGITYDYLISTSDFVNESTLSKVIEAKAYKNLGYPRNDLLLKSQLETFDELFCDQTLLEFAKKKKDTKLAVYMPTHRENTRYVKPPLDFGSLNEQLKAIDTVLIVKFHPFVLSLYGDIDTAEFSHILFHDSQADIYPLLRYADVLVTDYSSICFDFMLLERPIVFFDYDRQDYESNMGGFVYPYEQFTIGQRVKTQNELIKALQNDMGFNYDALNEKLNDHIDCKSTTRICKEICE